MPSPPPPPDLEPSAIYAQVTGNHPSFGPFLVACRKNDLEAVLRLAQAGNQDDGSRTWGLSAAMEAGHLDVARALLSTGVKWDGLTVANASNSVQAVQLLREFGFKVNDPMPEGHVLLPGAVANNDEEMIRYLLRNGADPNLGKPRYPRGTIAWKIRPEQNSGAALNACACSSTPEIFALLLSWGAKLENATPLHCAAAAGQNRIPMMQYLLELGCDVNAIDGNELGRHGTPLQLAFLWERADEARWLLEHGADADIMLPHGGTTRKYLKQPEDQGLTGAAELASLLCSFSSDSEGAS